MSKFHNRTRASTSIPRKLLGEGKYHLLPVYYLLCTSELAREGIENSGSYRFADHIYEGRPRGKYVIGYLLDALLLNLKSARSLRSRYLHAKDEMRMLVKEQGAYKESIDILAVPCGLGRELFEVAQELRESAHPHYKKIKWHGLDLDENLIAHLDQKNKEHGLEMRFLHGDALSESAYPKDKKYDMIISTGFTEFLDDEQTLQFYTLMHDKLKCNGKFFTSGMMPHEFSDYLLRNIAELHTSYRSESQLKRLAGMAGFKTIHTYRNQLQTILIGVKA